MSSDDPVGAYVKPYDSAQEVITLHNASGLALHGNPSRDHSWFPGYGLYFSSIYAMYFSVS
jgi:cereblon